MFEFSIRYTNLPLDVIHDNLGSLIIKMHEHSKSVYIMVSYNRKKAFWTNGYKLYKLLEAILFKTYIQFNGSIYKQILRISTGGNASPFIADL